MTVSHPFVCHPDSRFAAVSSVQAEAHRAHDGALLLRYTLAAAMTSIAVPVRREPRRVDGLWRHTCFECFVAGEDDGYLEFNFSPSAQWAAYAFSAYRQAAHAPDAFDPRIAVEQDANSLELRASIPAKCLPRGVASLRIGLSAVIEEVSGAVTYWALRHAPGKPDFHRRETFAITL